MNSHVNSEEPKLFIMFNTDLLQQLPFVGFIITNYLHTNYLLPNCSRHHLPCRVRSLREGLADPTNAAESTSPSLWEKSPPLYVTLTLIYNISANFPKTELMISPWCFVPWPFTNEIWIKPWPPTNYFQSVKFSQLLLAKYL